MIAENGNGNPGVIMPPDEGRNLPELVDRASQVLANARSSAELLNARDMATFAYDIAKRAARLARSKNAHDTLVAAAHRVQGDALLIESQAKHRLADEYDAAQERGEVATAGNPNFSGTEKLPGWKDLSLPPKDLHEARKIRDAEQQEPGIVAKVVNEAIKHGQEPTRAAIRRAVVKKAPKPKQEEPTEAAPVNLTMRQYITKKAEEEEQKYIQNRDFRALKKLWKKSCPGAQQMFRDWAKL
jgi:hypothetical protein